MIVTVTPNPSVDRALELDRLGVGEVNRAHATHVHAGGKGINVSRALVAQGLATRAVLPAGGSDGELLVQLLAEQAVPARAVPVRGETRSNITLVEATGVTTKVNAPGPALGPDDVDALLAAVEEEIAAGARGVVGAGSLPRGTGDEFFVRLAALAGRHGVPCALDTSGAPLAAAVAGGGLALVKPNDEELGELVGRELVVVGDVTDAARALVARGTRQVLVSLGAHGALLVDAAEVWWAGGPPLVPASTVGAGDATLAGFLAAPDDDPARRLATAVAWGRAAVLLPGTAVPDPADIRLDDVRVVRGPDPDLALKDL
ncbi:1-phosphofructokinase [Actinotalea ferrariae]|uniref:1-phosphofructokinase n=1 Tax=Actinotalea ferrariae TaxID=1386098 RepID=UPI001C8CCFBD|nr:1-phosphofructokinase [Actinotalea ferrariae]MBX9245189.1 1-phosphofructokinase [Actinotalea ferrariae]